MHSIYDSWHTMYQANKRTRLQSIALFHFLNIKHVHKQIQNDYIDENSSLPSVYVLYYECVCLYAYVYPDACHLSMTRMQKKSR